MRIITLCSDGAVKVKQQSVWSGYSEDEYQQSIEMVRDIEAFLKAVKKSYLDPEPKNGKGLASKPKEIHKLELKKKIDKLLDELNNI